MAKSLLNCIGSAGLTWQNTGAEMSRPRLSQAEYRCLPDGANGNLGNLDRAAVTLSLAVRPSSQHAGGAAGRCRCRCRCRPRGQRSPVVSSGAWCRAGKLEGSERSPRGGGDNARNGPLLRVRQKLKLKLKLADCCLRDKARDKLSFCTLVLSPASPLHIPILRGAALQAPFKAVHPQGAQGSCHHPASWPRDSPAPACAFGV